MRAFDLEHDQRVPAGLSEVPLLFTAIPGAA